MLQISSVGGGKIMVWRSEQHHALSIGYGTCAAVPHAVEALQMPMAQRWVDAKDARPQTPRTEIKKGSLSCRI